MRIDLFAHFTTQEFRQAYLSIPLGAKGRRLDPIAIRTFVQAQRTTDSDVLWDIEQRLRVLDRYGIDLQVITQPPSHYWKSMYHDTAAVDANAFACGFNVFGADHVVFATDYPYGRNKGEYFLESRRRFVDQAQIDAEARQKIYEENAKALLHLG